MDLSASPEGDSCSSGHETACLLRTPKIHHRVHKSSSSVLIQGHMKPLYSLCAISVKLILMFRFHYVLRVIPSFKVFLPEYYTHFSSLH